MRRLETLAALVAVFAIGGEVPALAQTETIEYYALDAVGSVRAVFEPSGTLIGRIDFMPFGEELGGAAPKPKERFAGLFRDGEAGLDYAEARRYQSRTGRMTTGDPLYAGLFEPQAWNRYSYALNNPLSFQDRSGLQVDENEGTPNPNLCTSEIRAMNPNDFHCGGGSGVGTWAGGTSSITLLMLLNNPAAGAGSSEFTFDALGATFSLLGNLAASMIPGAGETLDALVLSDSNSGILAKTAATGSLVLSAVTRGFSPNFGAALKELRISASQYPELANNIQHAQNAGHPTILTHGGASTINRSAALDQVPRIPGLSRDEYPFASSVEGGSGSWVGHIPLSQQQAQGGLIRAMNLKPGEHYVVVVVP